MNETAIPRYSPPASKEWKNIVYNYNGNDMKNLPVYNLNINTLIKWYFSLYFNHKFIGRRYLSPKSKRQSLNKIFVSKAEIKHTNHKVLITLYVYNRERLVLLNKIKDFEKVNLHKLFLVKTKINEMISKFLTKELKTGENLNIMTLIRHKLNEHLKFKRISRYFKIRRFLRRIRRLFSIVRRFKLKLTLNKYKFEEKFLCKLSEIIGKYYGKKVEFTIVNLKSMTHNSDIFTEILTTKLKKEKSAPLRRMNLLLSKLRIPKVESSERQRLEKLVNYNLPMNRYQTVNISNIINKFAEEKHISTINLYKDNLTKLLYNLYYKETNNVKTGVSKDSLSQGYLNQISQTIIENIKYKAISGARLRVKGRLTRRYRADRSLLKVKWTGGLKNRDSSFKGISTAMYRGYLDANLVTSTQASKRKIGSFAVKGWFSSN